MLAREQEMISTIQDSEVGHALVLKPKEKIVHNEVPKEVDSLLQKYKGIVVGDTPDELPPLRDICQKIDFLLGASLPNKATYKLTLDQNAKVTKQVGELLTKGLIQKSLSPCAVLSVLAPKNDGKWRLCTDSRAINIDFLYPGLKIF